MSRSRASAKSAGTRFETDVCKALTLASGSKIYRAAKSGSLDKGDIHGVSLLGKDVIIECKNPGKRSPWKISQWWNETMKEKDNNGSDIGILVVSSYGRGVNDSACIVDEPTYSMMKNHIEPIVHAVIRKNDNPSHDVSVYKDIPSGVQKIKDNLSPLSIIRQKRTKSDSPWYIFPLSVFSLVIDRGFPTLSLELDEQDNILPGYYMDSNGMCALVTTSDNHDEIHNLFPGDAVPVKIYDVTIDEDSLRDLRKDSKNPYHYKVVSENSYPYTIKLANPYVKQHRQEELFLSNKEIAMLHNGESVYKKFNGKTIEIQPNT